MFCVSVKPWLHSDTYLGSFFLDPEDVRSLSLGAVWNLVKEQGSHDLDIRLWDTKGLSRRHTYVGTERAQTCLLFHTILLSLAICKEYQILKDVYNVFKQLCHS